LNIQAEDGKIDQMQDPELSIEQAVTGYRRLGYSENWINQRLKQNSQRQIEDNNGENVEE
jgi:hypothetical protein